MEKIIIDLKTCSRYYLLRQAQLLAVEHGLDSIAIVNEMTAGDTKHFIATFEKYFSEYVTLIK